MEKARSKIAGAIILCVACCLAFAMLWPGLFRGKMPFGSDDIYRVVDTYPAPPGGIGAFETFLSFNSEYPETDQKNDVHGRVIMEFVVEKDGALSNFKVLRAPSLTLGQEALRVFKKSYKWTPALKNGKIVRAWYVFPMKF
jgi:TonB family protein